MSDVYIQTLALMGTVVTIKVVGHAEDGTARAERVAGVERAAGWFREIESCCTRFESESEVRQLSNRIGEAVPVSAMLFEAVQFAVAVAEETNGAFDPTVGAQLESRGFDRDYRTGKAARSGIPENRDVSWRDVRVDSATRSLTLLRPLVLDLGAVAKGLAIDMAARELEPFTNFGIDAGGDVFVGGHNESGAPWSVGIRHPRDEHALIETMVLSNSAVCTSGDYERVSESDASAPGEHHIIDARSGTTANALASVTVVAQSAMVADALGTAAFALGPQAGLRFLERQGVRGVMFTPALERLETAGVVQ